MRFSLLYEIALPIELEEAGKTESDAFWEAVEQIVLAEEMGFDAVWLVEHHFLEDLARSSANDIFLAAIAQHTKRIRIGLGVTLMPPGYTHPFKIAERVASLDLVTRGRVEWGCGRSTTAEELDGFGIDTAHARQMMVEAMTVVPQMWRQRVFPGYKGEYMDLPERVVVPKPVQKPHPPIWMACGSPTSYRLAGEMGVGCLSFTISTPDELNKSLEHYREGIRNAKPVGDFVNNNIAGFTTLYIGDDDTAARERGGLNSVAHHARVGKYYGNVSERAGYNERSISISERIEFERRNHTLAIDEARMCVGGVETCEKIIRQYEAIGIDEFMGVVQFNEITHEESMRTIRLMGERIIPKFRKPVVAEAAE
ncbi:MAG: LLM class flavin-dependent oxidoreductase [Sphingomonadales bacterium]|nr:LLM class flavin-dependent oxidoreductase [Sphingomonadales bacterium]